MGSEVGQSVAKCRAKWDEAWCNVWGGVGQVVRRDGVGCMTKFLLSVANCDNDVRQLNGHKH